MKTILDFNGFVLKKHNDGRIRAYRNGKELKSIVRITFDYFVSDDNPVLAVDEVLE